MLNYGFILSLVLLTCVLSGAPVNDAQHNIDDVNSFHKFHVSTGRLGVEGNVIVNQTRFFKNDLTAALRSFGKNSAFDIDTSRRSDSLFLAYFNAHFVLNSDGRVLDGIVAGSGEDVEGKERVWWYIVRYDALEEPRKLVIHNTLLTEQFDDQKNLLKVQKFPSERSDSYFFDHDETRLEIVF